MALKKKKLFLILLIVVVCSAIAVAVGMKFFPFSRIIKMPAGQAKELAGSVGKPTQLPNTLYFDFEIPKGKETPGGFYKGDAHSGQYAVKAFGKNSFSFTVEKTVDEIGLKNLGAVALSAWIYVFPTKEEVKGAFVFTASNDLGVNVCWQGISVHEPEVPRGKWFKISGYFDLTSVTFKPGYKIQVYFWNTSSTDILIDDYFISFGGAVDRRGDSALVDMTKPAGYVPRYNYPPFPVSYLGKLSLKEEMNPSEAAIDDLIVAGNFSNTGMDDLLIYRKNGMLSLHNFCKEKNTWMKTGVTKTAQPIGPVKSILSGRFLGTGADQVVLITDDKVLLCSFKPVKEPCSGSGTPTMLTIVNSSGKSTGNYFTGDFSGIGKTELLVVNPAGTWKLMSYDPAGQGAWKIVAESQQPTVAEWNQGKFVAGITAGNFLRDPKRDQLLTVAKPKSGNQCTFAIHRFNPGKMTWEPCYSSGGYGKTVGLDTLKPEDKLYMAGTRNSQKFFRYNRDWRFDLKEISFNDSTFTIHSGVDFQNFDLDHNPKYYESLKIVPGCFQEPGKPSCVIIGKNAPGRGSEKILPDFIHLYSTSK